MTSAPWGLTAFPSLSLTLYEERHPQCDLGNRQVQHQFLQHLAQLLPATSAPIIATDAGFKVPF